MRRFTCSRKPAWSASSRRSRRIRPALVIVDSIQTIFSLKFQSAPGSIGQVREAATQLLFAAKGQNVPILLVGHVTKEGSLAGPKALEHVVDTVLYFEGERHHSHRVVRAVKNRFGAISELGVFEMTAGGLKPVPNPSKMFLAERPANAPGSAVLCSVEGSRPILVEVQALVSTSTYGNARRMANGVDTQRLSLLLAVLEKRAGLNLIGDDVFVNIAGGMTIDEPAADLAIVAAIASSVRNRVIPGTTAVFGEIGPGGRGARHHPGRPAHPRGGADGLPALHHAGGQHRSRGSDRRRWATANWLASAAQARRSMPSSRDLMVWLALHSRGTPMAWFVLARVLIVAAVAYSAALLQPLPVGLIRQCRFRGRSCRSRRYVRNAVCATPRRAVCSVR